MSQWLIAVLCIASFATSFATAAAGDPPANDKPLMTLCAIVETAARNEGLPVSFFTRLISRESAFRFDALSSAGAQGIAQFMPRVASERGLADPFDLAAAIPASAKLLAELAQRFGNLGLAAAAYNAGPDALADWLAGKGVMPLETQDYVLAITGHRIEEWRNANPPPSPDKPCLISIMAGGAQIGAEEFGIHGFAGSRHNYGAIGHMQLLRLAADAKMTARAFVLLTLKNLDASPPKSH